MKYSLQKLLFFTFLLLSNNSQAQEPDSILSVYANYFPKEKIHVHFDKTVYNKEETIWYKVYILDGQGLTSLSKNVYVEWYDTSGKFMKQAVSPLFQATAKGAYELPADYKGDFIRMKVYTKWGLNDDSVFRFQRNITINNDDIGVKPKPIAIKTKLDVFPEGGDLVNSMASLVAFKAYDQFGKPVKVKALLTNDKNKILDTLDIKHDGMGSFILIPKAGEAYSIKWNDNYGNNGITKLPAAKQEGVVMAVRSSNEFASVKVDRTNNVPDNFKHLNLLVHMNQEILFKVSLNASDKTSLFAKIPIEEMNTGVLQFSLFTSDWLPLAERILFINNRAHEFGAKIIPQLVTLTKRGKNVIDILVSDTTTTNMSISITDGNLDDGSLGNTIYADLLLNSEIKGKIYNPGYYLSSDSDSVTANLDLVMLTNGWRRFNWDEIRAGKGPKLSYLPESETMKIRGLVYGLKNVSANELLLNMVLQNKDSSKSFLFQQVDKDGYFETREQMFYDTAKLFYSFNQNPKLNDITQIQFDNGLMKPSSKLMQYTDIEKISLWNDSIARSRMAYFLKLQEDWKSRSQYKTLQEVIVKTRQKPKSEALDERYASGLFSGGDAQVLDFMNDPASLGGLDLFTYLQGRVPGLMISRSGSQVQLLWRGANPEVYLDQQLVGPEFIQSMNIRDIAIIKIFRPPFFGGIGGGSGGAIAIYSKKGADMRMSNDSKSSKGMAYTLIAGYSRFKEFFSPDYEIPGENSDTDIRTTLYWSPYVITNKKHPRFKIQFFNNDFSKKLNVVLEGINTDGKITRVVKVIE
ncbi:MAG: hypothetical protein RLZZ595_294 [Bacteroidota bacterium]|jgi:hypothetical protein